MGEGLKTGGWLRAGVGAGRLVRPDRGASGGGRVGEATCWAGGDAGVQAGGWDRRSSASAGTECVVAVAVTAAVATGVAARMCGAAWAGEGPARRARVETGAGTGTEVGRTVGPACVRPGCTRTMGLWVAMGNVI